MAICLPHVPPQTDTRADICIDCGGWLPEDATHLWSVVPGQPGRCSGSQTILFAIRT
jgi:hypothetical protein